MRCSRGRVVHSFVISFTNDKNASALSTRFVRRSHGTHCAATLAGFNGDLDAPGTGMAPMAKLAMFDSEETDTGALAVRYPEYYASGEIIRGARRRLHNL